MEQRRMKLAKRKAGRDVDIVGWVSQMDIKIYQNQLQGFWGREDMCHALTLVNEGAD